MLYFYNHGLEYPISQRYSGDNYQNITFSVNSILIARSLYCIQYTVYITLYIRYTLQVYTYVIHTYIHTLLMIKHHTFN